MVWLFLACVALYLLCAIAAYGICFAHFQGEFPLNAEARRRSDAGFAAIVAISGPLGLIVIFFMSGFAKHGWRVR
jgi:hypothetical protein